MSKDKAKKYDPADEHDPLFSINPEDYTSTGVERQARPKSIDFAICPDCSHEKVGLIASLSHLVYREHYRTTTFGRKLLCRASGAALCDHPPTRKREGADIPACKHLPAAVQAAVWSAVRLADERARDEQTGEDTTPYA